MGKDDPQFPGWGTTWMVVLSAHHRQAGKADGTAGLDESSSGINGLEILADAR